MLGPGTQTHPYWLHSSGESGVVEGRTEESCSCMRSVTGAVLHIEQPEAPMNFLYKYEAKAPLPWDKGFEPRQAHLQGQLVHVA